MSVPNFPPPRDIDLTNPFWEATDQGELRLPACSVCGAFQWYPVPGFACHPEATRHWREVAHTGTVFTFSKVERAFLPFGSEPPYTLILVALDDVDNARLVTVLVGDDQDSVAIGSRVELSPTVFETHTLPTFRLSA